MCGIVGYVPKVPVSTDQTDFILKALQASQHRGYQGAGIVTIINDQIDFRKTIGNVANLRKALGNFKAMGIAMAHTRWHTHGKESEINSHPHLSNDETIAVVHNGEIYNYEDLKKRLVALGFRFVSETDTEVVPNLIQYYLSQGGDIKKAVSQAMNDLDGSNAFVIMTTHLPDQLIIYNNSQTLTLVENDRCFLVVSDEEAIPAGSHKTTDISDEDFVFVGADGFSITNLDRIIERPAEDVVVEGSEAEKEGYTHFMQKEIMQQPHTLRRTLSGRLDLENMQVVLGMEKRLNHPLDHYTRVVLLGIGTSYHACMVGKYYFEHFAKLPTDVIMAPEFAHQTFLPQEYANALVIAVSQSGKSIELVDAVKNFQERGVEVAAVSNVVRSAIPKMTRAGLFLKAGPEKAVASTKAFTSQLAALYLIALMFAQKRGISKFELVAAIKAIDQVPALVEETINSCDMAVKDLAGLIVRIQGLTGVFNLGRGVNWPVTFEGALKMLEVAYINARGYSASEMFHGPRAMLDDKLFCIAMLNEEDPMNSQMQASIEKCRSASSPVAVIVSKSLRGKLTDPLIYKIPVPNVPSYFLLPFVNVIPLQLLSYYLAVNKGNDPDFPRNLAKVITTH